MQDNLTGDEMAEVIALHPEAAVDKTLSLETPDSPETAVHPYTAEEKACQEIAEGLEELEELPSNVTLLDCTTRKDIPVDRILQGAKEAGLEEVVVVGFTKEGEEYLASSTASISATLFNLARGLHHTQRTCDDCFSLSSNVRPAE